ncbi:hypothetical protein BC829DRAFT_487863 [Chytridium lagenaria]|nr:hypothetical protein BC829DRAFT_487863 [Chytridium lagenaria]
MPDNEKPQPLNPSQPTSDDEDDAEDEIQENVTSAAVDAASSSDLTSTPKKKKKKKKKKPVDPNAAPVPTRKPVIFIDDPNWVTKTIPVGWSTNIPQPLSTQPEDWPSDQRPPTNWDDAPIRAMLQDAVRRDEELRQKLGAGGQASVVLTNMHGNAYPETTASGWDAPIQGVQFISTGFAGGTMWGGEDQPAVNDDGGVDVPSNITELD